MLGYEENCNESNTQVKKNARLRGKLQKNEYPSQIKHRVARKIAKKQIPKSNKMRGCEINCKKTKKSYHIIPTCIKPFAKIP